MVKCVLGLISVYIEYVDCVDCVLIFFLKCTSSKNACINKLVCCVGVYCARCIRVQVGVCLYRFKHTNPIRISLSVVHFPISTPVCVGYTWLPIRDHRCMVDFLWVM